MPKWNAWPEERCDQIKALWAEGLSASTIASKMGGLTRSAVLGKIHRLKCPGHDLRRKRTPEEREIINAARRERRAQRAVNGFHNYGPVAIPPTLAPINGNGAHLPPRLREARHAPPVAYAGEPVSILEVTGCKYAVKSEGREHRFCNAPSDGSWCPFHETIVWNP